MILKAGKKTMHGLVGMVTRGWVNAFFVWILVNNTGIGQHDVYHVYLFGNVADVDNIERVVGALEDEISSHGQPFTLILNGDLIGADRSIRDVSLRHVQTLMDRMTDFPNGELHIIPGDRDWDFSGPNGYALVRGLEQTLENYTKTSGATNVHWAVPGGCPGPFVETLDDHLVLITLNSQWWNHPHVKPVPADASCDFVTDYDIREELEDLIQENSHRNILIVGHHPIKSIGNYGGRFSLGDHLRPFPIIGSFEKAYQQHVGRSLDLSNARIRPYIDLLHNTLFWYHNLIYASSHEKNQQILQLGNDYLVNSGAPSKTAYAGSDFSTTFQSGKAGLMKLSYHKNGNVNAQFLAWNEAGSVFSPAHDQQLFASACQLESAASPNENLLYLPCRLEKHAHGSNAELSERSAMMAPGAHYDKGAFSRLWMGHHYRDDWASEIAVDYLDIDTAYNGLEAIEKGGSRRSLTLKFQSEKGEIYTFRSIDKDPSKALDYRLRSSIISRIFQDQTSAQHPYGALIVADLLDHLDILHADPKLCVLPDVRVLGPFQKQYGGMMGMLEENPGRRNAEGHYFARADDVLKTNELLRKMYRDRRHRIDQSEYIRARLFDIWVGDWDRNENNWRWAAFEEGDIVRYRPIPRDRDQAFSKWDGIIPSLADLPFGLPNTESFDHRIKGFRSLVFEARHMDRFLLQEAGLDMYLREAQFIQDAISDADVIHAVRQLPRASFDLSGQEIIEKLKARKADLVDYAKNYYDWLNREVEVLGSSRPDRFDVQYLEEGRLHVRVYPDFGESDPKPYYERVFQPDETKEVRLYGLGGDDKFGIRGHHKSRITVRLLGGEGRDTYDGDHKHRRLLIYDRQMNLAAADSALIPHVDHWDQRVFEYDRKQLRYNSWLPVFRIGYRSFNGATLAIGNTWVKQRWDKRDYASKHTLRVNGSTKGDFGLRYRGKWRHVLRKWNVMTDLILANPDYLNAFYGVGNNAEIDPVLEAQDFYLANYNQYSFALGLTRDFWRRSEVSLQAGVAIYNSNPFEGSILDIERASILGASGTRSAFTSKMAIDIDLRDHRSFPYRGIRAYTGLHNYASLQASAPGTYGRVEGSVEYYVSTYGKKRFTLGLKWLASKGYGDIPYYHQSSLGATSGLRAYTNNRFKGRSKMAFNSECRWELLDQKEASIPWKFGILGFYDVGRVFADDEPGESSAGYRTGYGFGFYVIPFSQSFTLTFTLGFSRENKFYPGFTFGSSLK